MSNGFDLLDKILKESMVKPIERKETSGDKNIQMIFENIKEDVNADTDFLIEESMKSVLRGLVLESDGTPEEKLEKYQLLESKEEFNDSDIRDFMYSYIVPITEAANVRTFEGDDPFMVPNMIYETALAIQAVRDGEVNILEDLLKECDSVVGEKKNEDGPVMSEETPAELLKGDKVASTGEKSGVVKEEVIVKEDVKVEKDPTEILETYLGNVFERWGVTDRRQARIFIEEADRVLKEHGWKNLIPDLQELSEMGIVMEKTDYNLKMKGETDKAEKATKTAVEKGKRDEYDRAIDKSGESADKAKSDADKAADPDYSRAHVATAGEHLKHYASHAKEAIVSGVKHVAAAGIGAASIALAIAAIWRKRSAKCHGKKGPELKSCNIQAAEAALKTARAQLKHCSGDANPEKCKKHVQSLISKWEKRKESYATA